MDKYNFYYIKLKDGNFVYRADWTVGCFSLAKKFRTKPQAVSYARKFYDDSEFTVKGGGGIKDIAPYEYLKQLMLQKYLL